jgi:hypothetical protein
LKAVRSRLTYANVMSSIAVFLVLGGATAFAAGQLGKNTVGAKQLKKNAVTAAKLQQNAVTGSKIAKDAITAEKIKNGAVTGAKVDVASLGTVPKAASAATAATATKADSAATISGYSRRGLVRVAASAEGASFEATRAASPEIALVTAGPFTVYGKCFNLGGTNAEVFIRTSENGSIFDSDLEELDGTPEYLNANTAENARELASTSVSAGDSEYFGIHSPEFTAMAPSGIAVRGALQLAAKRGDLATGNGIYGPGDVCLFAAEATVLNG